MWLPLIFTLHSILWNTFVQSFRRALINQVPKIVFKIYFYFFILYFAILTISIFKYSYLNTLIVNIAIIKILNLSFMKGNGPYFSRLFKKRMWLRIKAQLISEFFLFKLSKVLGTLKFCLFSFSPPSFL